MKPKILVITSTSRQDRTSRKIADWYLKEAQKAAPEADFEIFDIADFDLPVFDNESPLMAEMEDRYTEQQKEMAERISSADGYVFVLGEYNHSVPGSLKNFIDYLSPVEWRRKAAAFVSYGVVGGYYSIVNLSFILNYLGVMSILNTVNIKSIWEALDDNGAPKPEHMHGDVKRQLGELIWWAKALKTARNDQ